MELSKDELKMKLREAAEVHKMKTQDSWCNFLCSLETSTNQLFFTQGDWHIVPRAGSHTSLPPRKIQSSGDSTREGRTALMMMSHAAKLSFILPLPTTFSYIFFSSLSFAGSKQAELNIFTLFQLGAYSNFTFHLVLANNPNARKWPIIFFQWRPPAAGG